jgi:hypothetical protein
MIPQKKFFPCVISRNEKTTGLDRVADAGSVSNFIRSNFEHEAGLV